MWLLVCFLPAGRAHDFSQAALPVTSSPGNKRRPADPQRRLRPPQVTTASLQVSGVQAGPRLPRGLAVVIGWCLVERPALSNDTVEPVQMSDRLEALAGAGM